MRPRGTGVRFELVDQIDVEEPAAVTPRAVIAWERYMRERLRSVGSKPCRMAWDASSSAMYDTAAVFLDLKIGQLGSNALQHG
jgi:hypothetical protein